MLAGGRASRMGGTDKLGLRIGGTSLLDRVLTAAATVSRPVVVVGPARPTAVPDVTFVREHPAGGGPVPAVQAGLAALPDADVVLVLAGDLPLLTEGALGLLLDRLATGGAYDAAAAADGPGRPNPLLAAYRAEALRRAALPLTAGAPARRLLPPAVTLVDLGPEAVLNVNFPDDLERAARLAGAGQD